MLTLTRVLALVALAASVAAAASPAARAETVTITSADWVDASVGPYEPVALQVSGLVEESFAWCGSVFDPCEPGSFGGLGLLLSVDVDAGGEWQSFGAFDLTAQTATSCTCDASQGVLGVTFDATFQPVDPIAVRGQLAAVGGEGWWVGVYSSFGGAFASGPIASALWAEPGHDVALELLGHASPGGAAPLGDVVPLTADLRVALPGAPAEACGANPAYCVGLDLPPVAVTLSADGVSVHTGGADLIALAPCDCAAVPGVATTTTQIVVDLNSYPVRAFARAHPTGWTATFTLDPTDGVPLALGDDPSNNVAGPVPTTAFTPLTPRANLSFVAPPSIALAATYHVDEVLPGDTVAMSVTGKVLMSGWEVNPCAAPQDLGFCQRQGDPELDVVASAPPYPGVGGVQLARSEVYLGPCVCDDPLAYGLPVAPFMLAVPDINTGAVRAFANPYDPIWDLTFVLDPDDNLAEPNDDNVAIAFGAYGFRPAAAPQGNLAVELFDDIDGYLDHARAGVAGQSVPLSFAGEVSGSALPDRCGLGSAPGGGAFPVRVVAFLQTYDQGYPDPYGVVALGSFERDLCAGGDPRDQVFVPFGGPLELNTPAVRSLLLDPAFAAQDVAFEVRVEPLVAGGVVRETTQVDNGRSVPFAPEFHPLDGTFRITDGQGAIDLALTSADLRPAGAACPGPDAYLFSGYATWELSAISDFADLALALDNVCVTLAPTPGGSTVVYAGSHQDPWLPPTSGLAGVTAVGTIDGLAATLVLTLDGAGVRMEPGSVVALPADVTAHPRQARTFLHPCTVEGAGGPIGAAGCNAAAALAPCGTGQLELTSPPGFAFPALAGTPRAFSCDDDPSSLAPLEYLRVGALPFALHVPLACSGSACESSLVVTPTRVVASLDRAEHLRRGNRWGGSNDVRFGAPMTMDEAAAAELDVVPTIHVRGDGVTAEVPFAATTGKAHFPSVDVAAPITVVRVAGTTIESGGPTANELAPDRLPRATYTLTQTGACGACVGGAFDQRFTLGAVRDDLATPIAEGHRRADGAVAFATRVTANAGFGPTDVYDVIQDCTEGGCSSLLDERHAFERKSDVGKRGVVWIPGHVLPDTSEAAGATVVDSLLGSHVVVDRPDLAGGAAGDGAGPGASDYRGSSFTASNGTFFYAGLTVGPEVQRGANNQPTVGMGQDLAHAAAAPSEMIVGLGGTDDAPTQPYPVWATLRSNGGTKYLVRPAGVTGAFSFGSGGAQAAQPGVDVPVAHVYGYPMVFSRFAFRTRMNTMDPVTWVDGAITLPGRAGFGVQFQGLGVECTGQLAGGSVVRPPGDPPKYLQAWATPFDPLSIAFRPAAGTNACTGSDRDLWVQGNAKVAALERPLGLDAAFEPDGEPAAAGARVVAGDNVLDKHAADHPGFSVALAETARLGPMPKVSDTLGWFELSGKLHLPFWEMVDVTIRAESSCGGATALPECVGAATVTAAPTVVTRKGEKLPNADATPNVALAAQVQANAKAKGPAELLARYDWNGSGFGFSLPGYYQTTIPESPMPGLLGLPIEEKYPFIDVKAGMDFANPQRTKVSFGASANLDAKQLTGAVLSVDLQDPKSIERVDGFVRDVRGFFGGAPGNCQPFTPGTIDFDCHPVATTVSAMSQPATFVMKFAGPGLDSLIRTGVTKAFEALGGPQIIDALAAKISEVKALPGAIIAGLFDGMRQEISKLLQYLSGPLEAGAAQIFNDLPAQVGAAVDLVRQYPNQSLAQIDAALNTQWASLLTTLRGALADSGAALGAPLAALDQLLSQAAAISGKARGLIGGVATQITAIETTGLGVLDQVDGLIGKRTGASCTDVSPDGGGGALAQYFTSNTGQLQNQPVNALWLKVKELSNQVEGVLTGVKTGATGLIGLAGILSSLVGVDSKGLTDLSQKLEGEATRLQQLVIVARGTLEASIQKLPFDDLLNLVRKTSCQVRGAIGKLTSKVGDILGQASTPSGPTGLYKLVAKVDGVLQSARGVVSAANTKRVEIVGWLDGLLKSAPAIPVPHVDLPSGAAIAADIRQTLNGLFAAVTGSPWCTAAPNAPCLPSQTFVAALGAKVRTEVDNVIAGAAATVQATVQGIIDDLPIPSGPQLRDLFYNEILDGAVIAQLQSLVHENLVLVLSPLNDLGQKLLTHVNGWVKEVFDKFDALVASLLESAQAAFKALPFKGAKVDGYAVMSATELERLHIGAEFQMNKSDSGEKGKENDTSFKAALDVVSWSVNGKGKACLAATDGAMKSLLDATIKIENVPLKIGTGNLGIKELAIGMTLELSQAGLALKGINGRIYTMGSLAFAAFELFDMGLELGIGEFETYLGARAKARFSGSQVEAAFLVGKTCNIDVLKRLDPEVGNFIDLPNGVFAGFYVRGALTMPIYNVGCLFTIGAGIEVGFWYSAWAGATTVGGLIGASVYGQAACLVSVRGGFRIMGQVANGKVSAQGTGYAIGGIGFCEPEKWTSIAASRSDDWCAKAAATFQASYKNDSLGIDGFSIDAVY